MRTCIAFLTVLACGAWAAADDWPAWRGPDGQGHCAEKDLPLTWSKTENVKWSAPLQAKGNSTPVVSRGRVFLTQANKEGTVRGLLCFDRADGKRLWQKEVAYEDKERVWDGYCNASPAADGERVVVSFASAGMYCYDYDGKELWKRTDLGKWDHVFGNGSSPVLYEKLAILWCGPNEKAPKEGRNFLLAVDRKTGQTAWEHDEPNGSWGTPLVARVDGRDQLILGQSRDVKGGPESKAGYLKGFDPKTGKELWACQGLNSFVYTSALYANGVAVGMSGYGGSALAVKLGGAGDVTKDRLWHHPKNVQRVGSGVVVGDHVYILEENGLPHCYELATGNEVWQVEKPLSGASTWSSMVATADGRLYVMTKDGRTLVFAASPKYELLATNKLGGSTNASIAVSDGELFIRTAGHLWCIGRKP